MDHLYFKGTQYDLTTHVEVNELNTLFFYSDLMTTSISVM